MLHRVAVVIATTILMTSSAPARPEDSFGWVLVSRGSTVATSTDELSRLDARTPDSDRVLYARFGADRYVIRDPATLDRADALVESIRRLGEKARQVRAPNAGDKDERREWKERLRPFKEKRRELLLRVSPRMEALARDAVANGKARRMRGARE